VVSHQVVYHLAWEGICKQGRQQCSHCLSQQNSCKRLSMQMRPITSAKPSQAT